MKDPILINRLFDGFKETSSLVPRIDFRQFVRTLATMSKDPIEERMDLLFDVWDADDSGSLSYQELANHVVHDEPVHKKEPALHAFSGIWSQIKNFAAAHPAKEGDEDDFAKREAASGEVTRENLVDAATRLPGVRLFFEHMLTRRPPKADELARHMVSRNFQARLRELDGEVAEEVRAGVRGDAPGTRPNTAVGPGKKEVDVEKQRQQAIKEKTDAILKTVSLSHSSSLGAMHSSSAKAVAAARQQANQARPKTVAGTGTRSGGRPRRQIHAFVGGEAGSKSTGALEPLSRQRSGTAVSMP